ncbi:MAG TPA: hypothetical protein VMW17_07270 [Candidatus Binatia bacterium]|nr:hypothetical protein [Candidatus Binatia bacterium]
MSKVTIAFLVASTTIMLVTFGKGMSVLHGGDVGGHLQWALIAMVAVLVANCIAIVHAAQSDRIIRTLRRQLADGHEQQGHGRNAGTAL